MRCGRVVTMTSLEALVTTSTSSTPGVMWNALWMPARVFV